MSQLLIYTKNSKNIDIKMRFYRIENTYYSSFYTFI